MAETFPRENEMFTLCHECEVPLVIDFSIPGMEWRCPKCGEFTMFFDRHKSANYGELTDYQKKVWHEAIIRPSSVIDERNPAREGSATPGAQKKKSRKPVSDVRGGL